MSPEQADLVRKSFDTMWPVRKQFAELFYRRFFELAPDTRHLFPTDLHGQHLKLMDMMAAIVATLDERELFQSITTYAGRRHARFGANPAHFATFGEALIWSLESQLGSSFTPELRGAWITLYDAVRSKMISAAGLTGTCHS